jgi:hypothetical protein
LAALAVGRALDDPGVFHESAEQGINEVVVHVVVAQQEARELFKGVAVPRAFPKSVENN